MNYDEIIESAESLANAYLAKENYIIARYEYAIAANEGGGVNFFEDGSNEKKQNIFVRAWSAIRKFTSSILDKIRGNKKPLPKEMANKQIEVPKELVEETKRYSKLKPKLQKLKSAKGKAKVAAVVGLLGALSAFGVTKAKSHKSGSQSNATVTIPASEIQTFQSWAEELLKCADDVAKIRIENDETAEMIKKANENLNRQGEKSNYKKQLDEIGAENIKKEQQAVKEVAAIGNELSGKWDAQKKKIQDHRDEMMIKRIIKKSKIDQHDLDTATTLNAASSLALDGDFDLRANMTPSQRESYRILKSIKRKYPNLSPSQQRSIARKESVKRYERYDKKSNVNMDSAADYDEDLEILLESAGDYDRHEFYDEVNVDDLDF